MNRGSVPCIAPTPAPDSSLAPSHPPVVVTKDSAKMDYCVSMIHRDVIRSPTAVKKIQVVQRATLRPNLSLTKEIAT